jgi:hypothetical protein
MLRRVLTRRFARPLLKRVALLVLWVGAGIALPTFHAIDEAGDAACHARDLLSCDGKFTAGASCPVNCPNPAHHHRAAHDHATCPLCQSFARPAIITTAVHVAAPTCVAACQPPPAPCRVTRWQFGTPSLRGPPAA